MNQHPTPLPPAEPTARPALVIAGHGTRDAAGAAVCRALVDRVRSLLPGVRVEAGFVELTPPTIDEVLSTVLTNEEHGAVVVPLMIGAGGHVQDDIPDAIVAGRREHPGATVVYTRHLGAPASLVDAALARIEAACEDWPAEDVTVVFVGRGCSVTDANADHVRLSRVIAERGGYAQVLPAFIQVVQPTVADALNTAAATGARRVVVMPHYLFPGLLSRWVDEQALMWRAAHPDVDVRVAGVLGDCPELAQVVATRYREGELQARRNAGSPAYPAGLLLSGRRVVAVGGGCVNRRRVPALLTAGARVTVVSPELHPALADLHEQGRIAWVPRTFEASDLDGAWYVLAATDSPEQNARVAAAAEERHTFCVRADKAERGSAWTPATGRVDGATVAVLADGDPRRSRALRDRLVQLAEEDR